MATAQIVRDRELLESMSVGGKLPWLATVVHVTEAFVHCPKAFLRSDLWNPESWPNRDSLPSMARILNNDALARRGNVDEIAADLDDRHRTQLY